MSNNVRKGRKFMKSPTVRILCLVLLCFVGNMAKAQIQTDPVLTAAVALEKSTLENQLKKENEKQLQIIGINTGITVQLEEIRQYEEKMYKYLKETQNIIRNAYDIYRCGDLVTQIYNNLRDCTDAIVGHPQGAIVSTIVSKQYSKITQEASALYGYISGLVTKSDGSVLLNSAERNMILTQVTRRLSTINRNLTALKYQIRVYRWADIARHLAPKEYYMLVNCENIKNQIKRDIDRMSR